MRSRDLSKALQDLGDSEIATNSQRFFKTGKGEYGEGDVFIGVRVPVVRNQAARFRELPLGEVRKSLHSPLHEERLCALIILTLKFARADEPERQEIYDFYLANRRQVNNWDLVDCSAHKIVGPWLLNRDRQVLYDLSCSKNLWERRIAVMATLHFIKQDDYVDTLALSESLLDDEQDLIHKITGWMLREVGKRDVNTLTGFLDAHVKHMPRTMLRYAIEKLPGDVRQDYMTR